MKTFVVTAHIELTKKPEWLDRYREQFDKPYAYHVTIKQPCYVEAEDVTIIQSRLATIFTHGAYKPIPIRFSELKVDSTNEHSLCIMIRAEHNPLLAALQDTVVRALPEFSNYRKPESKQWEEQFDPHITIARAETLEQLQNAQAHLGSDIECEGEIREVVLIVVDNWGAAETEDPHNRTIYAL